MTAEPTSQAHLAADEIFVSRTDSAGRIRSGNAVFAPGSAGTPSTSSSGRRTTSSDTPAPGLEDFRASRTLAVRDDAGESRARAHLARLGSIVAAF